MIYNQENKIYKVSYGILLTFIPLFILSKNCILKIMQVYTTKYLKNVSFKFQIRIRMQRSFYLWVSL